MEDNKLHHLTSCLVSIK